MPQQGLVLCLGWPAYTERTCLCRMPMPDEPREKQLTRLLGLGRVLFTGYVQFKPPLEDQLCSAVPVLVRNVCTCMSGAEAFPLYWAMAFSIIQVELSFGTLTFV